MQEVLAVLFITIASISGDAWAVEETSVTTCIATAPTELMAISGEPIPLGRIPIFRSKERLEYFTTVYHVFEKMTLSHII